MNLMQLTAAVNFTNRVNEAMARNSNTSVRGHERKPSQLGVLGPSGLRAVRTAMSRVDRSLALMIVLLVPLVVFVGAAPVSAAPEGQVVWGVHTSLVPSWFDPAEMIQG